MDEPHGPRTCIHIPRVDVIFQWERALDFHQILVICLRSPRKVKLVHRGGGVGGRLCFPGSLGMGHKHLKILQTCLGDTGEHRTVCALCEHALWRVH